MYRGTHRYISVTRNTHYPRYAYPSPLIRTRVTRYAGGQESFGENARGNETRPSSVTCINLTRCPYAFGTSHPDHALPVRVTRGETRQTPSGDQNAQPRQQSAPRKERPRVTRPASRTHPSRSFLVRARTYAHSVSCSSPAHRRRRLFGRPERATGIDPLTSDSRHATLEQTARGHRASNTVGGQNMSKRKGSTAEVQTLNETMQDKQWDHALGWSISYLQTTVERTGETSDETLFEAQADAVGMWPFGDPGGELFGWAMSEAYEYVKARGARKAVAS